MDSVYFWPLMTLAAIFVGMGKGGLPVVAGLAVPSLSLIMSPVAAAGLLLPIYIVSDIFAIRAYRRDYNWQVLKISLIGMSIGVLVGGLTAHIVLEWVVTLMIGLMGLTFSLKQIFKQVDFAKPGKDLNSKVGIIWCTIADLPALLVIMAVRLGKYLRYRLVYQNQFLGTSVLAFSYCNLIKAIPYFMLNQMTLVTLKISLYLMLPAAIAVFIGVKIIKIIPENIFLKL